MVIDGKVRQSCSALIDDLLLESASDTVTAAADVEIPERSRSESRPIKDVRSSKAGERLDRARRQLRPRPGPHLSNDTAQERYAYSRCMTCGCCLEACPQYSDDNYIGPQAIAQARLFNMHPVGKMEMDDRLNGLLGEDGIGNCGNAQNCVQVCPMNIPLTRAIYETNRDVTVNALFGWLKK
jgi:succinate dehydrogenase / fumarate reductase iron-sulfur subunit